MKNIKIYFGILSIIILIIIILSCVRIFTKKDSATTAIINTDVEYEVEDEYTEWENETVTYIKLNNTSTTIDGSGATATGTSITISKSGIYHLTGALENGTIIIDTSGTVRLILDNANITAKDTAPINIRNAKKVIISLEEGTTNYITDGETYVYDDTTEEEPDGAIFSKDDLVINGTGILNVTANFKDAIVSKDTLKIMNGKINITAQGDGIRGKDCVAIKDGIITINSQNDGIKSTNDTDSTLGFILIENGTITINAQQDAFQAETNIVIENGDFDLTTGGGAKTATTSSFGNWGMNGTSTSTDTTSAKGIKAKTGIQIINGTFNINSSDDSIHSNTNLIIENGTFQIASGDDRNTCR